MSLPLLFGAGIAAVNSIKNTRTAEKAIEDAKERHNRNVECVNQDKQMAESALAKLDKMRSMIIENFGRFADLFGMITNRPEFTFTKQDSVDLPEYDTETLNAESFNAISITAACVGWAANIISPIPLLTLPATAIFMYFHSKKNVEKARELEEEVEKEEQAILKCCNYLHRLYLNAEKHNKSLKKVNNLYVSHLDAMMTIICINHKTNWEFYSEDEKLIIENTQLLTGLLFSMCKVQLVKKSSSDDEAGEINEKALNNSKQKADRFLANNRIDDHMPRQYFCSGKGSFLDNNYQDFEPGVFSSAPLTKRFFLAFIAKIRTLISGDKLQFNPKVAIWVVDADIGAADPRNMFTSKNIDDVIVFITNIESVDDTSLLDLIEWDCIGFLNEMGFSENTIHFIRGSINKILDTEPDTGYLGIEKWLYNCGAKSFVDLYGSL